MTSHPGPRSPSTVISQTPSQRTTWLRQHSTWTSMLRFWVKPAAAFLIYALTLSIAATATRKDAILGKVSASQGTTLLTVLSKAGDVAFGVAVADVCDSIAWRGLANEWNVPRGLNFQGVPLPWFLALISTTGVEGLLRILQRSLRNWGAWSRAGRWSILRLLMIFALIPGPGIILMANIDQKAVIFPSVSTNVTGGVGVYDPKIARDYAPVLGADISSLIRYMLLDRSIAWKVDPVSEKCRAFKSCRSYILAGPYWTVAPSPFTQEQKGLDWYIVEETPVYQVDLWEAPANLTFFRSKGECGTYGGVNLTGDYSMALCIAQQSPGVLSAGWASCAAGLSSNLTCLTPGSYNWTTSLQFYRRTATIVFSRLDRNMEEVSHMSEPVSQNITAASLFQSIDTFLYRYNNVTSEALLDINTYPYILTQRLAGQLYAAIEPRQRSVSTALDMLLNVLTLPVFLFTPTTLVLTGNDQTGSTPQPNVDEENRIKGAYCTVDERSIPGKETVIAYGAVAGVVIIFIMIGKAVASLWPRRDTTEFPMLDFEVLTTLRNKDNRDVEVRLKDKFQAGGYEEGSLLEDVPELMIGLRIV